MPRKRNYITGFHGTSADNLPSILKHGLGGSNADTLWIPSMRGTTYLWSPKHLLEHKECEQGRSLEEARFRAVGSGETALVRAKDCRIVLIEVRIPEEWADEDWSCPNMEGAIQVRETIPASMFRSIEISQDLSLFKAFSVALYFQRDNVMLEPTWEEQDVTRLLKSINYWPMPQEYARFTPIEITQNRQYGMDRSPAGRSSATTRVKREGLRA